MGQNPPAPGNAAPAQPADGKAVVSGKVTDKAGKPVAGAVVLLVAQQDPQQTRTDAQGNFAFRTIKSPGQYYLYVQAKGFLPIEYSGGTAMQLTPQSEVKRDLTLEKGASIVVTVTNEAGDGLKGVRVHATPLGRDDRGGPGIRGAITDDTGMATLTVPPSTKQYMVYTQQDGFAPAHASVTVERIDDPVDVPLALERGQVVKGVAMCNDGKPATGWEIYATPDWWTTGALPAMAKVDAQGNFTLRDLGPGVHKLNLHMRTGNGGGSIREIPMTITVPAAQQPIRVDLPLASPASRTKVAGKVRITGGRPDYISISAIGGQNGQEYYDATVDFRRTPAQPDKDGIIEGSYSFEGIPAGTYQLQFQSPITESKTLPGIKIPGEIPVVDLKVLGKPHLTGTVTDAATGTPITQFSIRARKLRHLGNAANYSQESRWIQAGSAEGRFDLEVVSAGVYQVQVMAEGHATARSKEIRVESADARTDVQVQLMAGGTLTGTITDAAGKPVEGAKVSPFSVAGYDSRQELRVRGQVPHFHPDLGAVKTDAAGRFTLAHLAAGDEKIRIAHPDFAPQVAMDLKVTEGQTADAGTIKLSRGGAAEGVVYDENGKPAAGVSLEFRDQEGWSSQEEESAGRLAQVTTDEEGKFRVEHLPAMAIYILQQRLWERQGTIRRVIRPVEGRTARVDFGGPNAVSGTIIGPNGPAANARVQLAGESAYSNMTVAGKTDGAGRFTFYGPPAGKYSLYFSTDMNRQNWTWVKDVDIPASAQAMNLGELKVEGTDLLVTLESDDPAELANVQYVMVEPQSSGSRPVIAQRDPNGGPWRAGSVTVGKYRVAAGTKQGFAVAAALECDGKEKEKTLSLRLPKATATLSGSLNRSEGLPVEAIQSVTLANEDQTVLTSFISRGEQPRTVKLPPGTYRAIDPLTRKPREDVPAITLADGDTKTVELSAPALERPDTKPVTVGVWSADGVLVPGGKAKVLDASGKAVETPRGWYLGSVYVLPPGRYRAIADGSSAEAAPKEFEVTKEDTQVNVDVYLPE